eukprot:3754044-Rhodomonas_salina.2
MCGTELAYGVLSACAVCGTELAIFLRDVRYCASVWCYGMCGTELAYGATRLRDPEKATALWSAPLSAYACATPCPVLT